MKRTATKIFLFLTVMLGLIYIYTVMTTKESSPSGTAKSGKWERFTGVIKRAGETGRDLVVKRGDREMAFSWSDQTKFTRGKKEISFADVKEGMKVTVQYREAGDGKLSAFRIYVHKEQTG